MPDLDLDTKMPDLHGPNGSKKGEISEAAEKILVPEDRYKPIKEAIAKGEPIFIDEEVHLPIDEERTSVSSTDNKHSNMNPQVFSDLRKVDTTPEMVKENSEHLKDIGFFEHREPVTMDNQLLSSEVRREYSISLINSLEETIKNGETDLKKAITENNLQPLSALDVLLKTRKLSPGEFDLGKDILKRKGIDSVSAAQELALEFLRNHYAEFLNKDK